LHISTIYSLKEGFSGTDLQSALRAAKADAGEIALRIGNLRGINDEKANAFKASDQASIFKLMREIGVKK